MQPVQKNPEMPAQNGPEKVAEDKGQVPDCHVSKASATCSPAAPVGLVSVPSRIHPIASPFAPY